MSPWLLVVLCVLATYRAARFITADTLIGGWRTRTQARLERRKEARTGRATDDVWQSKLAYLLGCHWCTGVWVSGGIVAVVAQLASVPLPVLVWGAVAGAAALLAHLEQLAQAVIDKVDKDGN